MYHSIACVYDWEGTRRFTRNTFTNQLWPLLQGHEGERLLLDLGCGTGNLAELLWEQGWEVVGVDLAHQMLQRFHAKGIARNRQAHLLQSDIRRFALGRRFPVITCLYDAVNHLLNEHEFFALCSCVRQHLEPGGRFIFDLTTRDTFLDMWSDTVDLIEADGHTTIITSRFDEELSVAHARVIAFLETPEGRYERREEDVFQYCFTTAQIRRCLKENGLTLEDRTPFTPFPEEGPEPLKEWWVVRG